MKKLLTTFAAFTALTAAASAADLPRRAAPPVFVPVPVFTWTGFYFGVNAGYGFDAGNSANGPSAVVATGNSGIFQNPGLVAGNGAVIYGNNSSSLDGFTGGGQVGYNYQFTPGSGLVVGIEADAQYVDFGRNRNTGFAFIGTPNRDLTFVNPNGLSGLDYFGTVRGRVGYAFDRVLFYGTGGFAYGGGGGKEFGLPNSTSNDFRTGYAVGGGVEYALPTDSFFNFFKSSAVTFKVEGLYVNLERNQNSGIFAFSNSTGLVFRTGTFYAAGVNLNNRREDEFAVVRAGLNYKFGTY